MSVELQDAATVVLLRDGDQGLEVLMGRRNTRTRFSAGAWVFPGGAVDAADAAAIPCCHSVAASEVQRRFGEDQAQRYFLAAARELFEEAGVWLFSDETPQAAEQLRRELHHQRLALDTLLRQQQGECRLRQMHYFAFWTTPPLQPRRYRTRFFAARMPQAQQARADGVELTALDWVAPAEMLERHAAGAVSLIFPTLKQLQWLAGFASADEAWQAVQAIDAVDEVRTRHRIVNGRSLDILMPGDPGYDDLPAW